MAKRQTILVSDRGQITLPQAMRQRLGIKPGPVLVAEEKRGKVILQPAVVTPVEIYSDEEMRGWLVQDRVSDKDRKRILKRAGRR